MKFLFSLSYDILIGDLRKYGQTKIIKRQMHKELKNTSQKAVMTGLQTKQKVICPTSAMWHSSKCLEQKID